MMTPLVTERMPLRICSLLPSATEIVFALGLNDHLVGVTHECDFPPEASRLPVVTRSSLRHGTRDSLEIHHHISAALHTGSSIYTLDQELLERLDPDLILTQELCDVCAVSYELVKQAAQIPWSRIVEYDPEIVVLIPCGFTLEQTVEGVEKIHLPDEWRRLTSTREARVYAANGSAYFNRPGPRIVDGLEILAEILHP